MRFSSWLAAHIPPLELPVYLSNHLYRRSAFSLYTSFALPMGADLCSTFEGRDLEILYAKPSIMGNICAMIGAQNWSILQCWILGWDVLESTFLLNSYIGLTVVGRNWCNRKGTYAKLAFVITKSVHKLLVLWQNIGGTLHIVSPKQKLLGDTSQKLLMVRTFKLVRLLYR